LLREIEGVIDVDVDIEANTAIIKYDASKTSVDNIIKELNEWDYDVEGVEMLR